MPYLKPPILARVLIRILLITVVRTRRSLKVSCWSVDACHLQRVRIGYSWDSRPRLGSGLRPRDNEALRPPEFARAIASSHWASDSASSFWRRAASVVGRQTVFPPHFLINAQTMPGFQGRPVRVGLPSSFRMFAILPQLSRFRPHSTRQPGIAPISPVQVLCKSRASL